jgi:N-acetylmuramoyl-L-alanine amidase
MSVQPNGRDCKTWHRFGRNCSLGALLLALQTSCLADAPVIGVDVGHSISAPGAISARGIPEFDFNVSLARFVQAALSSSGANVVVIGGDGDMSELRQRTAAAVAQGAGFLLSIHHDSVQPQYLQQWEWQGVTRQYTDRISGFSLFVSRTGANPEASLHCARRIGAALKQSGLRPSPHHAEKIAGENREWADRDNGVYYYDNLVVLKTATMPAVLLEAGVIVNREEELRVQTPEVRSVIAGAISRGLSACGVLR